MWLIFLLPKGDVGAGGFTYGATHGVSVDPGYSQTPPTIQQPRAELPRQVVIVKPAKLGPHPMTMTCPNCNNHITTSTSSEPGAMAWIIGGILCMFV